jgi:hypothetical protein
MLNGLIYAVVCKRTDCLFNSSPGKKEGKCEGEYITITKEGCKDFKKRKVK